MLTGAIDGVLLLRRNLHNLLAEEDWNKSVACDKGCIAPGALTDLPSHAILDRGRIAGLWEYDPATASIAWMSFIKPDAALRKAVERTEEFVRNDLGDARSLSLDSPKSRPPRIKGIRALAATAP